MVNDQSHKDHSINKATIPEDNRAYSEEIKTDIVDIVEESLDPYSDIVEEIKTDKVDTYAISIPTGCSEVNVHQTERVDIFIKR
jgi:hypothetical protein